jgi:hypothetical protein
MLTDWHQQRSAPGDSIVRDWRAISMLPAVSRQTVSDHV